LFGGVASRFSTPKHQRELDIFSRESGNIPLNINNVQKGLKDLSGAGLSENEIAESIAVVSAFAGITRIVDATGHKCPGAERGISIVVPTLFFIRKNLLLLGLIVFLYFFWK